MIKSMLEKLLSHLHRAVFDTTADTLVAFYLDGPAGSSWVAINENFDVTFADGSVISLDLNKFAVWQLIDELEKLGMTVTSQNAEARYFSGITMLELSGKAGEPQPITLYKDILHAIFGAYSREMRIASDQVGQALNQLEIPKADDGFLDQWGDQFGISREGMSDADYRIKIPQEAFRVRVNSYAIEKAIKDETGFDITLDEPWRDIFRLDESMLSGASRLYKEGDVGYFLVQPVSFTPLSDEQWAKIYPIIDRNIAAGVIRLEAGNNGREFIQDPLAGNIWWQTWSMRTTYVYAPSTPRLDNEIRLSGGYRFEVNYRSAITEAYSEAMLNYPVVGRVRVDLSRMISTLVRNAVFPIREYHTATWRGAYVELYPTDPRTWRIGHWERDSTWGMPYNWRVGSRQTALETSFFADATAVVRTGIIHSEAVLGSTWDDLPSWNNDDWTQGETSFWPSWFDASNNFTPVETVPYEWEMTAKRSVKSLFNMGLRSYNSRYDLTLESGIVYKLDKASGPAVVSTVNDHTFSVNTTGAGDVVIIVTGTAPDGSTNKTKITIHVQA
ncbi:hypothetical protein D0Q53_20540 [Salmonella enterica]|nr:hypothetical protein [Salmonella enterica]EBL0923919.1 hypothetical protein [Salmonella enterica]EHF0215288.1 hypothetical protein [Salmonella enterica]EJH8717694.1 hypothetical protein [Escherichia coli]